MATTKLYYSAPYETDFTATVVSATPTSDNRWRVILDRTLFYPEGGGQPADRGMLDGIVILDVQEQDDEVIHYLAAAPQQHTVAGSIDWQRRFDHMQQHTGQHLLSAILETQLQAPTVGFHLGEISSQIDVEYELLTTNQLALLETEANRLIWAALPVSTKIVGASDLTQYPLRKQPAQLWDALRLVQIDSLDYSLCCGTHVSATQEIGLLKIRSQERKNGRLRLDFVCGYRALHDYQHKQEIIQQLSNALSAAPAQIPAAYAQQQEKTEALHREYAALKEEWLQLKAAALLRNTPCDAGKRLIVQTFLGMTPTEAGYLARQLIATPGTIALLAAVNQEQQKVHCVFAAATDVPLHMGNHLKSILPLLEGKGGGNAQLAQGGGANLTALPQALAAAQAAILKEW